MFETRTLEHCVSRKLQIQNMILDRICWKAWKKLKNLLEFRIVLSTTSLPNFGKLVISQALSVIFDTIILVLLPGFLLPILQISRAAKGTTSIKTSHAVAPNTSAVRIWTSIEEMSIPCKHISRILDIKNIYTNVLDVLKLGVFLKTFLLGKISL